MTTSQVRFFAALPLFLLGSLMLGGVQWSEAGLRHVTDSVPILREGDRQAIETVLEELQQKAATRVLVVTVAPLSEEKFSRLAESLFETWAPRAEDRLVLLVSQEGRFAVRFSGRPAEIFSGSRLSEKLDHSLTFGYRNGDLSSSILDSVVTIAVALAQDSRVALEALGMQMPAPESAPPRLFTPERLQGVSSIWLLGGLALIVLVLTVGIQQRWIDPASWWRSVVSAVRCNREFGNYVKSTQSGSVVFRRRRFGALVAYCVGVVMIGLAALGFGLALTESSANLQDRLIGVVVLLSFAAGGLSLLRTRDRTVTLDRDSDRLEGDGKLRCHLSQIRFVTISESRNRRKGVQYQVEVQLESGLFIKVFQAQADYSAALSLARAVKEVAGVPFRADQRQKEDSGITRLNLG